ncbi:rhodanese-like domain-containing protein [Niameybacter massiliensis]|uniref:Rhodanese-like domain-containing protein n=1 Tax=Holtiella tumoricola TaxID=3018743 RepID=A0AA42DL01_9FIRM|nr:rhodanese-like domain-containing protein [Holtiella tumoricola]MDA3731010.1 rhodanese-like domain-containing protein [Holtiella tumoricola]
MKKLILMLVILLFVLTGCTKEKNVTFEAQIESVSDQSMMVTTSGDIGFDKASVGLSTAKIKGDLVVGGNVTVTIHPEIRETYPVQATAIEVEVMDAAYEKISAQQAKEMIDKGEYGVILDVRTLEEYNEGHIEGATLLPDNEIKDKAEITLYDKEEVILVYCRSGRRSEAAAKVLVEMGYTKVYDFGGIIDWPYEVVKE